MTVLVNIGKNSIVKHRVILPAKLSQTKLNIANRGVCTERLQVTCGNNALM